MSQIPKLRAWTKSGLLKSLLLGVLGTSLSSCAISSTMRYSASSPSEGLVDTTAQFNGLTVELRALTPREAMLSSLREDSLNTRVIPDEIRRFTPGSYRLGKHDVLTVAIWEHPELTMPLGEYRSDNAVGQILDDSGQFFFPYVGTMKAEGLTTGELSAKLRTSLVHVLNNPQLDVKVTAFRSQKVYVNGAVGKPASLPITDVPLSILDAINQAGGILATSDPRRVELLRDGKIHTIDLDGGRQASTPTAAQIWLKDGDIVRVPQAEENKVYVLGEVEKVSALPVAAGKLTLINALTTCGGLNPLTAQSKGIYVMRAQDSTRIQVWHLDARNPLALATADRFTLRPKDVVYVDASNLATWNRVVALLMPTVDLLYYGSTTANNIKSIYK